MRVQLAISSLCFLILWCVDRCWTASAKSINRPLRIGAFNIQNLGSSKFGNRTIMNIVKKILVRYDLVLIQEIVTTDETLMETLVKDLNKKAEIGSKYKMVISERLGRGTAKEQYAYLYREDMLSFKKGHSFPDHADDFMRPPFIVKFSTPTLRDMASMIVIGIHTQPKYAANETSALAKVYDYASKEFKTKDAIIMGDMNAGCANVRISDWDHIDLWNRKDFTWLIGHEVDTTHSINCCPYDRFVIAGAKMKKAVIPNSVNVLNYMKEFRLARAMASAVSDHNPIEVELRGGTSEEAQDNINPSLCVSVEDIRQVTIPNQLRKQKSSFGFTVTVSGDSLELYASSTDSTELLENLEKLEKTYGDLISRETIQTVLYKAKHGALEDITSHADIREREYWAAVDYDATSQTTTVHYCVGTTIN